MSLDFHTTARQISSMASDLHASHADRQKRLHLALGVLKNPFSTTSSELLDQRVTAAANRRVTWLVAEPPTKGEALAERKTPPKTPLDYCAVATDGSQIDLDRHGPANLYLINIGGVMIRYGSDPRAHLFSEPRLYSATDDMVIRDPAGSTREQAIEGPILGISRMIAECEALESTIRKSRQEPAQCPIIGLVDGSLVLWELSSDRYPDFVRSAFLQERLIPTMDKLSDMGNSENPLGFGAYISRPRSTEVINILRVSFCPHDDLHLKGCDYFCGRTGIGNKECNAVASGLTDRDLFAELLEPGERSTIFASQSPIVLQNYGRHRIFFFYLNVGDEIARLEIPQWVAENPETIDLLHGTILDQCAKGNGYPISLQEAHERAVVTAADRRHFWNLVGAVLREKGLNPSTSEKAQSKRVRAI